MPYYLAVHLAVESRKILDPVIEIPDGWGGDPDELIEKIDPLVTGDDYGDGNSSTDHWIDENPLTETEAEEQGVVFRLLEDGSVVRIRDSEAVAEVKAETPSLRCPRCQSHEVEQLGDAHVEMGEWDGKNYEFDADMPVHQCKVCHQEFILL